MAKKIIFLLLFLILLSQVYANRYYVKPDGSDSNNGTSWQTSFKTITKAFSITISGDEVWVSQGTYQEGHSITVTNGVTIYGGFNGTETNVSDRNIENSQTIIDGNNSYGCVYNKGIIDGFYVTKGKVSFYGGGIYNEGFVKNCIVYDKNKAHLF